MKKLTTLLAVAVFGVALTSASAFACGGGKASCSSTKGATATTTSASKTLTVAAHDECPLTTGKFAVASMDISGMTCAWCENNLTERLQAVPGAVMVVSISAVDGKAKVVYDKSLAKEADFVNAVSDDKFSAEIIPAVAITTNDQASAPKLANSSGKSSCQYSGKSATASTTGGSKLASKGAGCCASKGGSSMTKSSNTSNATFASSTCSAHPGVNLTSAEMAKFCSEFCSIASAKSDTKTEDS